MVYGPKLMANLVTEVTLHPYFGVYEGTRLILGPFGHVAAEL